MYEQTADLLSSCQMDGRTSKWTGIENVIGEVLQVRFKNSPRKGMIAHSSSIDL